MPSSEQVSDLLLQFEQWLWWRAAGWGGKVAKVPVVPSTCWFAWSTVSSTWNTFVAAREQELVNDVASGGERVRLTFEEFDQYDAGFYEDLAI